MIKYKLISTVEEKKSLRKKFLDLFKSVYKIELEENVWEHQILNFPYSDSPLFLAFDGDKIIGTALMILQKCIIEGKKYNYFLFTTSAILKEYRSKGIYAELIKKQKEYAKENKADFIFAFPNKIAYPVLKLFGGFKDLKKNNLVKTTFENLNLQNSNNSLVIDNYMFQWRFEHREYMFNLTQEKVIIFKEFQDAYDLLAIYDAKDFKHNVKNTFIEANRNIITLNSYTQNNNNQLIDTIYSTYFPINKNINYSKLSINLLMSDVF